MMMPVVDEIEERVYKEQLEVVRIDIEKETEITKIIVSKLHRHLL